jgi:hypothetical protein
MFRVPESTTNVKLDRINADLRVVKEIGAHIDINIKDDDIVRVAEHDGVILSLFSF